MKPWIGVALFSIMIHGASSLKDRRTVVRSLSDRAQRSCNASVADLGPDGCRDRADVAFSCVGSSRSEVEQRLRALSSLTGKGEDDGEFEIFYTNHEVFLYDDIQNRAPEQGIFTLDSGYAGD